MIKSLEKHLSSICISKVFMICMEILSRIVLCKCW